MSLLSNLDDTIVAIATPLGHGGIGIVRLSGKDALRIADQMFFPANKKKPSSFRNFTVHYGYVRRGNELIDEALLTIMRAPRSYTREDVIEISSHGGIVASRSILRFAVDLGARLAEPGEFTKRAFLNGRIDLTQAEAVLDTINAKTEAFLKVSANQLKGELSLRLEEIREELMNMYVALEAMVNFPEDDTGVQKSTTLVFVDKVQKVHQRIIQLLNSSEQGRVLKEGIRIVLCGKPNVGKSSLLNLLLKQPRAIVSPIAGTTRDTIEEIAQIRGIPFQLVDTAGILEPRDLVEEEAVRRARVHIQGADLVLLIVDASALFDDDDQRLFDSLKGQNFLVVFNKCDLEKKIDEKMVSVISSQNRVVHVSALMKEGIEDLEDRIVEYVCHAKTIDTSGVLVSNMRHIQALQGCCSAVEKTEEALENGLFFEFVSEEIKLAVSYLDMITGRCIDNDLLEQIFAQFCIGK